MKSFMRYFLISFYFLGALPSFADQKSINLKILDQNLQAMDYLEEEFNSEQYGEFLRWAIKSQENLFEHRKRRVAFSMIDKDSNVGRNEESQILNDPITWKDLTFFCGQKDVKLYLADKVDRTHTALGKAMLYGMLAQPISNISVLKKRQTIIKELIANQELFDELASALKAFKKSENMFLSYYCNHDPFKQIAARRFFTYGSTQVNYVLNKNGAILNIRNFADHLQRITFAATSLISAPFLPFCGLAQIADYQIPQTVTEAGENLRSSKIPFFGMVSPFLKNQTHILAGLSMVAGVISALNFKENWEWMTDNFLIDTYIQAKIMHVARVIECLQSVEKSVKKNEILLSSLERFEAFSDLLNEFNNKKELKDLFNMLAADEFNSPPSLLTNKGKIFVAYKLFADNKQSFEKTMIALGELDAYMSIASLYKEYKQVNACCCFAEYIEVSTPSIELEEFWNPFLDSQKAVSNSIELGIAQKRRDMVLTGPNAGGKSTLLKAIAINVIMAQSFGIVCAHKARLTPFHKIMTYLNITDDIGAGNSLFKAQVARAQLLLDTVKSLTQDQFSFTIIDEMFNGTSPKEAQACAFSVAKNLGEYPNNISIIATHFALLTQLEFETKHFDNYHVSVEHTRAGGIVYPFKLQRGISDQHVALDILKAEGFEGSIVAEAHEIMARL